MDCEGLVLCIFDIFLIYFLHLVKELQSGEIIMFDHLTIDSAVIPRKIRGTNSLQYSCVLGILTF